MPRPKLRALPSRVGRRSGSASGWSSGRRRWLVIALACALVAGLGTGVWWWQQRSSGLAAVTQLLPASTERIAFTDWDGVRSELKVEGTPSGRRSERIAIRAADRDISLSSTGEIAPAIAEGLGFDPVASSWEVLGQSATGMVVIWKYDDLDADQIAAQLASAGFIEPKSDPRAGGVWRGGADALATVSVGAPEVQHIALLEDHGLIVASDSPGYLKKAVPVARGDKDGLDVRDVAEQVEDPLAALILADGRACKELSTDQADGDAQATRDDLVEQVGGIERPRTYLVARLPGDGLDIVFGYEDDASAEDDRRAREALAKAEDPGQYLDYRELFRVRESEVDGADLAIRAKALDNFSPLTNLTSGPVLLATC